MSLAPYVGSSDDVIDRMLRLAKLKPGELLFDLGSGDGRILIAAARDYGALAVGVELKDNLVKETAKRVFELALENKVKVIHGDTMSIDISKADVVTLYLTESGNEKLRPKLEKELRPGSRVVSQSFRIPGWRPTFEESKGWRKIYVYEIGQQR